MVEGVDIKVEWEELIDSFSEDASTLQILSACINKFGDGGCGLSFSDWGAIVRNHLEEKELQSESFWDNFEYADSSDDDYYSEKEDTDEDLLNMVKDSLEVGGAGVAFGRNLFQAENPGKITRAISEVVHHDLDVEEALEFLK